MRSPSSREDMSLATSVRSERQEAMFAWITIIGIILYVVIDVIAQVLSPYNALRQPESDLAIGFSFSWLMTLNFVIRGLLTLALIAGLLKETSLAGKVRAGLVFLGIWAVGALLLALFPTDLAGEHVTWHGAIHLLVAIVAFVCVAVGEITVSRHFAADARWQSLFVPALILAIFTLIACLLTLAGGAIPGVKHVPGLTERIFLGLALLWMLVVAIRMRSLAASAS